ncbi:MAG TPA: hypothetical protein GX390_05675 [Acholeplasmataceae bacterium]|jgi:hypothetical protein|nr:hypothetical protein [Acholeplasmataceae bacterium]
MNINYNDPYNTQWIPGDYRYDSYSGNDERLIPFLTGALVTAPLWGFNRFPAFVPYPYPFPMPYPLPFFGFPGRYPRFPRRRRFY